MQTTDVTNRLLFNFCVLPDRLENQITFLYSSAFERSKHIGSRKIFDFQFLADLQILEGLELDLIVFKKCLYVSQCVCLHISICQLVCMWCKLCGRFHSRITTRNLIKLHIHLQLALNVFWLGFSVYLLTGDVPKLHFLWFSK